MKIIVGLGNPSAEYAGTRHNVGRDIVEQFAKQHDIGPLVYNKSINATTATGNVGKVPVLIVLPDTYMNKSGVALKKYIPSAKRAADLVVVHDELDLGVGTSKIVFDKSSNGHRGVESVIKAIKTSAFTRIKVGISPVTASGKTKKPSGESAVVKHVLGRFGKKELLALTKVKKKTVSALETIVTDGYLLAMNQFN